MISISERIIIPRPPTLNLPRRALDALRLVKRPEILAWAESELKLVSPGYTRPGPYRALPWQRELVNAPMYWDRVYHAGATQVGKSLCTDIPVFYYMTHGLNGMVAYANTKVVEHVFKLRYLDMIRGTPEYTNDVLRDLWSGRDDDLTIENLRLRSSIWRIASAQNRNDLATFAAAIAVGSEVAKWEKMRGWNPIRMLEGRQGSYEGSGEKKLILESSPFDIDDYLYAEVFKSGTIVLQPHYKCPRCGCYQVWTDSQIKLRNEKDDHSPARIRYLKEQAVYYECVGCHLEITEEMRALASERVVYAAPEIETEGFTQKAEKIYADGSIPTMLAGGRRSGYDAVCYNYPRLVDINYSFAECLAKFFETKNVPDDHKVYVTEVMARWPSRKKDRINIGYLETRKANYYQYGDGRMIPDDVLVLTYGGDSQDHGFYQSWYGWGYMMACWLIKSEYVKAPMSELKDPRDVYLKFREGLYMEQPLWPNGEPAMFTFGFQDRGGHRPEDVDFICQRFPNLRAYVGLKAVHQDRPLVYQSENGPFYLGQTELLSSYTGSILAGEDFWLPQDVTSEYLQQIVRQFVIKKKLPDGKEITKWIHGYSGPDDLRDCFNYAYAAAKALNLDKILFDKDKCEALRAKRYTLGTYPVADKQQQTTGENKAPSREHAQHRVGSYFGRAVAGGFRR